MIGPMVGLGGGDYTPIPISDSATGTFVNKYTYTTSITNTTLTATFYYDDSLTFTLRDKIYIKIRKDTTASTYLFGGDNYIDIMNINGSLGSDYIKYFRYLYNNGTFSYSDNYYVYVSNFNTSTKTFKINFKGTSSTTYPIAGTYTIQMFKLKN